MVPAPIVTHLQQLKGIADMFLDFVKRGAKAYVDPI